MSALQLHTIAPGEGARSRKKRVGRGEGSGKGKTAGRGTKGQRARAGGKSGLKLKGMKRMLLRIPKTRGFKSGKIHPATVTLAQLEQWFQNGATVEVKTLKKRNLIPQNVPGAKVVKTGDLKKSLTLKDLTTTPGAREAIEKAGGKIEAVPVAKKKKALAKKSSKK